MWHREVPRPGVEPELQLPACTTATAMWDPSRIYDLHRNLQPCWILNPLSEARQGWNPARHRHYVGFFNPLSHSGISPKPFNHCAIPSLTLALAGMRDISGLGSSQHQACWSQSLMKSDPRVRAVVISLSDPILPTVLRGLLSSHFVDEDPEAQRGEVTCPRSPSRERWSRSSSARPLTPYLVFVLRPRATSQVLWESPCLPPGEVVTCQGCQVEGAGRDGCGGWGETWPGTVGGSQDLRMETWEAKRGGRAAGIPGECAAWVSLCSLISSPPRFLARRSLPLFPPLFWSPPGIWSSWAGDQI